MSNDTSTIMKGKIHFLHINKTAGSQIRILLNNLEETGFPRAIVTHPHTSSLKDIPPKASYFFSLRDPVTRFRSGFYSRLRKGRPLYHADWSPHETRAFERFPHANDLAEALFEDGVNGTEAVKAIRAIRHTGANIVDWFGQKGFFLDLWPPIWIIRQERFVSDMTMFLHRIGAAPTAMGDLTIRRHQNDYTGTPPLSEKAIKNLHAWYAQDMALVRLCDDWLTQKAETEPAPFHAI